MYRYISKKQYHSDLPAYRLYSRYERRKLSEAIAAIPMEERIAGVMRFGEAHRQARAKMYPDQYCQKCYQNKHECIC